MDFARRLFGRKTAPESIADLDLSYEILLARSKNELAMQTAAHDNIFQLSAAEWGADLDVGTIAFSSPAGIRAEGPVQVIGTFNTQDNTWLWAWANKSIPSALCAHANLAKAYGERHAVDRLRQRKLQCSEADAWEFTAIANKLGGGQGAYC